jgi:hypothetical protein
VLGQEIVNTKVNALNTTINTSNFNNGIYFVKTTIGELEGVVKIIK